MKSKLSIVCREEGRGRGDVTRFADLVAAKAFISDRWQGADYMDGREGFHTDYSTYELRGFTLADIGVIGWHTDGYRTFEFKLDATLRGDKSDKPRIICVTDSEHETHHCRATEALIAELKERGELLGCWTDAEYNEKFGRDYVSESTDDSPAMSSGECKELRLNKDKQASIEEQVPF